MLGTPSAKFSGSHPFKESRRDTGYRNEDRQELLRPAVWDWEVSYDGRLSISNNAAENALRPFTVGRKNWLFADTPKGAKASAVVYSLIETGRMQTVTQGPGLYLALYFRYFTCLLDKGLIILTNALPYFPIQLKNFLTPALQQNSLLPLSKTVLRHFLTIPNLTKTKFLVKADTRLINRKNTDIQTPIPCL